MGWAIGYDSTWQRDIGYGVPAVCDHPGCGKKINRGLSYVCANEIPYGGDGCGLFFCDDHKFPSDINDGRFCSRCCEGKDPFEPTTDVRRWVRHKLTDWSWERWRNENPAEVEKLQALMER